MPILKCPECGCEDLTADVCEAGEFEVSEPVKCDQCGYEWNEIYEHSYSVDLEGNRIGLPKMVEPKNEPQNAVHSTIDQPKIIEKTEVIRYVEKSESNTLNVIMIIIGVIILIFLCFFVPVIIY